MKFLICGNLDAPDWILKEIEVLSKMSAIKFKLLCAEIVKILSGDNEFDYAKMEKFCSGYDVSSLKAIVAAVTFMLRNAAKYNVKPDIVSLELQQLGLPKRHATDIETLIGSDGAKLRSHLKSNILQLNRIKSVDWRVNYILSSNTYQKINTPTVLLRVTLKRNVLAKKRKARREASIIDDILAKEEAKKDQELAVKYPVVFTFGVNQDKFRVLLQELKVARDIMKTL